MTESRYTPRDPGPQPVPKRRAWLLGRVLGALLLRLSRR